MDVSNKAEGKQAREMFFGGTGDGYFAGVGASSMLQHEPSSSTLIKPIAQAEVRLPIATPIIVATR